MSKLADKLGVGVERFLFVELVKIDVIVTVAPTGPEKSVARGQQLELNPMRHVEPGIAGFAQQSPRASAGDVDEINVEAVLHAVEYQSPQEAVANPTETRDKDIRIIAQWQVV